MCWPSEREREERDARIRDTHMLESNTTPASNLCVCVCAGGGGQREGGYAIMVEETIRPGVCPDNGGAHACTHMQPREEPIRTAPGRCVNACQGASCALFVHRTL